MYRMLIVDDEYLVRMGLKETIDWSALDVEIIGEATNGQQGFLLACELKPDIIISDVKMPLMNGVEFVRKLREVHYDGKIIILSGYRDFEYAKETFENGVSAYVLKPVDNQEIISVVQSTLETLKNERGNRELYQGLKEQMPMISGQVFKDILVGNVSLESEIRDKLALFNLPSIEKGTLIFVKLDGDYDQGQTHLQSVKRLLDQRFSAQKMIEHIFDRYMVVVMDETECHQMMTCLRVILHEFSALTTDTISIGVAHFNNLGQIHDAYLRAQNNVQQKLFLGLNTINDDIHHSSAYKKGVVAAMGIIAKDYPKNITVRSVADQLQVSESYLMHLFKDNLGRTFNEVLTQYRIMVAKNLLASGKYRINEISDLVGYSDVKYFSLVFRKVVGMTPSAYLTQGE